MAKKKSMGKKKRKSVPMQNEFADCIEKIPVSNDSSTQNSILIEELLNEAEMHINTFNYESAQISCKKILKLDTENIKAMEMLAVVYTELCNWDEAETLFLRCVEISPQTGHTKYFSLAQLCDGKKSLEFYQQGISILEKMLAETENAQPVKDSSDTPLNRLLSDAYCSVGEIYMTDCCFEENAEELCKKFIEDGIKTDPANPETYQCLASFCLIKDDIEEAKSMIEKSLSLWLPQHEAVRDGEEVGPQAELSIPVYDSRIKTSKLLIELEMYNEATKILEGLIEDDDEVAEVWYLSGWLNYLQGEIYKGNSHYFFKKAKEVAAKIGIVDADQMAHIDELMEELGTGYETDEEECTVNDDEFCQELETSEDESVNKMEL